MNMYQTPIVVVIAIFMICSLYTVVAEKTVTKRKGDFCDTLPFNQTISADGCETKYMENNLCYGQCNSKYTPDFKTGYIKCAACRPTNPTVRKITLKCKYGTKKVLDVQYFEFCQCLHRSCRKINKVNALSHLLTIRRGQAPGKRLKGRRASTRRRRCRKKRGKKKKTCLERWRQDKKREKRRRNKNRNELLENGQIL